MWAADEKVISNELGPYMAIRSSQAGQVNLGLSNFMQPKHAHEHFDLIIHVDIIIRHKTIYCLDQEYNQTFIMKHRPVAPGWRVSRTSLATCTCTRVDHYLCNPNGLLLSFMSTYEF